MSANILILTEEFGTGHIKVAEALMQSISQLEPSITTQMIEPAKLLRPNTSSFIIRSYKKMIMNCPQLWRFIYTKATYPYFMQQIIYHLFHRNIEEIVQRFQPDLIICTHPFSTSSIARMKRLGHHIPLCAVITDLHAHHVWVQPEVDLYIVSHNDVRKQLIDRGIRPCSIAVTGMPIRLHFWEKNSKWEARKKLNLKNMPTIAIMGGGWGIGKMKEIAYALLKWIDSIQVLICTGTNETLRRSLTKDESLRHPHITIAGFVERIDCWFDAADLMITKPGGITIFEAITKGVPLLLYDPIPGHEEYNCHVLVNAKLAIQIKEMKDMDHWIEKLVFSPSTYDDWKARMTQFQKGANPLAGAQSVLQLLSQTTRLPVSDHRPSVSLNKFIEHQ